MRLDQFRIGGVFFTATGPWVCTDIGTRVVVAIEKQHNAEPGFAETVFDEDDMPGCSLSPNDFVTSC
jgi:hypothetical protein